MQINRLFEMIYLLLDRKSMTAQELADHFEVSKRTKGHSSSDVAHTLGFSSKSYFIRQFKKATGITPRLYRTVNA